MSEKFDQGLLFPELDPFVTKIKNIDYVDLHYLGGDADKKYKHHLLPPGQFFLFKSGGFNEGFPDLGNSFPYVINKKTGKNMVFNQRQTQVYPIGSTQLGPEYLKTKGLIVKKKIGLSFQMHRIAAEAFIENDDPENKKIVDHMNGNILDYRVKNLRWVTQSENLKGKNMNKEAQNQMNLLRHDFFKKRERRSEESEH